MKLLDSLNPNRSLKNLYFTGFIVAQLLLFIPLSLVSYRHFAATIDRKHALFNLQSEKDIRTLVSIYDDIRHSVVSSLDEKKLVKQLTMFENLFNKRGGNLSEFHYEGLQRYYKSKFYIVDANSLIVTHASQDDEVGIDLKAWPHIVYLIETMKEHDLHYRISWRQKRQQAELFLYWKSGKNIFEMSLPFSDLLNPNRVVEYIFNTSYHNPFIKNFRLYDAEGFRIHQDSYVPTDLIKGLLRENVSNETKEVYLEESNKQYMFFSGRDSGVKTRNIRMAEIEYDPNRFHAEKQAQKEILILFLLLSVIVAYMISRLWSRAIARPLDAMVEGIREISVDPKQTMESVPQSELNILVDSVNKMARNLNKYLRRSKDLSRKLMNLQETERQSIARDLHDSVGQSIVAAKMKLNLSQEKSEPNLVEASKLLDYASRELRGIYTSLYPPVLRDLGLEESLRWYVDTFLGEKVECELNIKISRTLSPQMGTQIFRIVQEALANILKHAQAKSCMIDIWDETLLFVNISDDGIGFPKEADRERVDSGFGFKSMELRVEELAGRMKIQNSVMGGLQICIAIPFGKETQDESR